MPGGSRRELLPLQENDVSQAPQGQMKGDAASDNAATDDDDLRLLRNLDHAAISNEPTREYNHIAKHTTNSEERGQKFLLS